MQADHGPTWGIEDTLSDDTATLILTELHSLRSEMAMLRAEVIARNVATPQVTPQATPQVEHYPLATACQLLGGVSRSTIYRELHMGLLERVPHTRRVLITRDSIERRKSARGLTLSQN